MNILVFYTVANYKSFELNWVLLFTSQSIVTVSDIKDITLDPFSFIRDPLYEFQPDKQLLLTTRHNQQTIFIIFSVIYREKHSKSLVGVILPMHQKCVSPKIHHDVGTSP